MSVGSRKCRKLGVLRNARPVSWLTFSPLLGIIYLLSASKNLCGAFGGIFSRPAHRKL
jgi:hypothetical protein